MGLWLCYLRREPPAGHAPTRDADRQLKPCGDRFDRAGRGPRCAHAGPSKRLGDGLFCGPLTVMIPCVASGPLAALAGGSKGKVG